MRKSIALLLGIILLFAITAGAAATLGINSSGDVAANDIVVASCDPGGVDVGYTTAWNGAGARYDVTLTTVSNIDPACVGQTLDVTLTGAPSADSSASVVVAGASEVVNVPDKPAKDVTGAHVAIHD